MGCTLPRAPAVKALSEGSKGQQQGSFSGSLAAQSSARRAPGSKGPWLGFASPHSQRLTPCVPRKCVRDVGSLALSSPAETCVWEGLGIAEFRTSKGSSSENSVRGKGRATAGLLQRLLGHRDSAPHGEHQAPRAPGWGLLSGHPEDDFVGAQKVYDRGRFPSTLLPSRDMCRCLGPDPACLGSCPQPQLRGSSP